MMIPSIPLCVITIEYNCKQLRYHHRYPVGTDTQDTDGDKQLDKQFGPEIHKLAESHFGHYHKY